MIDYLISLILIIGFFGVIGTQNSINNKLASIEEKLNKLGSKSE